MRRCRAALTALTLALMTVLVAGPAQAGGPTSVLLVVPGAGQTASLYTGDQDYEDLAHTVGAYWTDGASGKVDDSPTDHAHGPGVTLTWLIHDVSVWRVDRVYLDAEGGPWISTQVDHNGTGIWDKPAVWHTAVDADLLADVLHRNGVAGGPATDPAAAGDSPVQPDVAAGPDTPAVADETGSSKQAAEASGKDAGRLGWGLGGLALGVALTLSAMRLGRRSRPVPDQPMDVAEVSPDPVPDPAPWSQAEELQRR